MKALRIGLIALSGVFLVLLLVLGYLASFGILVAPTEQLNSNLGFMLFLSMAITGLPGILLSLD